MVLLLAGLALRFAGTFAFFDWLAAAALIPCLAGVVVLVGGWRALRWAWPALAFLVFMIPLPFRVEVAVAHPLQRVATKASTYVLQTLGFMAFAEGNVIRMGEVRLNVVEACSGLSMLVIFFALSTAVTLLVNRPWYEKLVIIVSAVPIALMSNITRIVVTGIMHKTVGQEWADFVFHDLAGWLMMPLALGMLWVELRLLAWVFIPRDKRDVPVLSFSPTGKPLPGATPTNKAKDATAARPNILPGLGIQAAPRNDKKTSEARPNKGTVPLG
jgi:exosortase